MLNPHRSDLKKLDSSKGEPSMELVLTLQFSGQSVTVPHDGFTIGSNPRCDLILKDTSIPGLHSVVHMQSGAIWIEVADSNQELYVNDHPYRRMALRHEDKVRIGAVEFTIQLRNQPISVPNESPVVEDLTLLTAEELCDRILSEQSMVTGFIQGRRSGWDALLRAIEAADNKTFIDGIPEESNELGHAEEVAFDILLQQIHDLNESVKNQTRELNDHEKEILESTAIVEESQKRALQQLDDILDKLKNSDPPQGLRASA